MITCSRCKTNFKKGQSNSHYCPPCHALYRREWAARNEESIKDTQFRYRYGISLKDYEELLFRQDFGCAICDVLDNGNKRFKYFSVDHDKETGIVRGLLCNNCNIGIGHLKHSPKLLASAIKYLETER